MLMYPVAAGVFAFLATAVGAHFFTFVHPVWYIAIGVGLFLLCNNFLYKLKFNSYKYNGSTVTTVLVFVSQVVSTGLYKMDKITWGWIIGVILILIGTALLEESKV